MIGKTFGNYEITEKVGEGGMGAVYRARDGRLQRDVALKVLPPALVNDAERLARFDREAQVLAQLNHPHIGSIYGFEESEGERALVLEFIEGPTLSERIARGAIPLDEALTLAGQMAEALDAAHEQGIVHRDLKPDNVKLAEGNTVKVLDFGLAKATGFEGSNAELTQSPTITAMHTQAGVILGTAAYMSPEQARGFPVDRRADIWSFGCLLFEMLTGRQSFAGNTITDVLAAVVRETPDFSLLPAATPKAVLRLLERCLEKDPKRRIRDMGDVWLALEDAKHAPDEPDESVAASRRSIVPWVISAVAIAVAALAVVGPWSSSPKVAARAVRHLAVRLPADQELVGTLDQPGSVALTPDGLSLIYSGAPDDNLESFFLYRFDFQTGQASLLEGTSEGIFQDFSPDDQWVLFNADGQLGRVPVAGGAPETLAEALGRRGCAWAADGTLYFPQSQEGPLMQMSLQDRVIEPLTQLAAGERSHRLPYLLPADVGLLYVVESDTTSSFSEATIVVRNLTTGETNTVVEAGTFPQYVSKSSHIVYWRDEDLYAAPFDLDRLEVTGASSLALARVEGYEGSGIASYFVGEQGDLVYMEASPDIPTQLVWMSQASGVEAAMAEATPELWGPRLSPDGRRVAVTVGQNIHVYDLDREMLTQVTFDNDTYATWSHDGRYLAYASWRGGLSNENTFVIEPSGDTEPRRLTVSDEYQTPTDWTHDGRWVLVDSWSNHGTNAILAVDFESGEAETLLETDFDEHSATISPDDRWFAYVSNETGRQEVYLRPFRRSGARFRVSSDGGVEPRWSPDGSRLYYRQGNEIFRVDVEFGEGSVELSRPKAMFENQFLPPSSAASLLTAWNFDVADGDRLILARGLTQPEPSQPRLLENFAGMLRKR